MNYVNARHPKHGPGFPAVGYVTFILVNILYFIINFLMYEKNSDRYSCLICSLDSCYFLSLTAENPFPENWELQHNNSINEWIRKLNSENWDVVLHENAHRREWLIIMKGIVF